MYVSAHDHLDLQKTVDKVVEECAERLADEDVDALCELVSTHLGGHEGMEVSGRAD